MLTRMCRNWSPRALPGGPWNGATAVEPGWWFLRKPKLELPHDCSNPTSVYMSKKIESKFSKSYSFTAAIFTKAKRWKQPKFPSTDERISKRWYLHAMQWVVFSLKREGSLITAWMSLEDMELRETRQSQKDKYRRRLSNVVKFRDRK